MAKKKKEADVREMSVKELQAQLQESLDQSFKLKFQHVTNPLKNPMQIRTVRRQIARLHTVLRQKEKVA